ncbi:hypothetical protein DUNSADRAFT_15781 [Dunaliella salina]|uniref:Dynein heavy chain ATP-binding dynein motor region domain-containing protein n=1 Tax=Dunaliella salina TaxID=3046 RepID=A0ABQ7H9F6_DUNSA|nr:hypothetical protein DUNSADRAFT_15781 [Dunaliella salina]|eukprot:KAF5843486.1 hypothetical protein DUNSADRAFT_15781 [Dunaliella salina]
MCTSRLFLPRSLSTFGLATAEVLQQNTFHNHHGEMCIKLGDASALYNPKFQMFVTTRLSNPRFPSNLLRHMCVINFSITKLQLQELLITTTLKHEMPEVENEHGILIKQKVRVGVEDEHGILMKREE